MLFPAPSVAVIALVASAVSGYGTWFVMDGIANKKELKVYQEGARRSWLAQEKVNEYQVEIDALRARKPRVVRYCPSVPAAASGPDEASTGADNPRDYGPLLRETLDELIRCNKLRESVK